MNRMDRVKAHEFLRQAAKNPKLLSSKRYIRAKVAHPDLYSVVFQVGPKCNLACSHCYGNYGPDREGVPKIPVVKRVLQQANKLKLSQITLTDGEPLMDENRDLVRLVAENSKNLPLHIVTNGKFADSLRSAYDWMNFLKKSGFNLRQRGNMMRVSAGQTYPVHPSNYSNVAQAASDIFGGNSFDNHLGFYCLGLSDPENDKKCLVDMMKAVDSILGKNLPSKLKRSKDNSLYDGIEYLYYPDKRQEGYVKFCLFACSPEGRAKSIESVIKNNPITPIKVEQIGFNPQRDMSLTIDFKGNVGFGCAQLSSYGKGVYGNIMQNPLLEIISDIFNDQIYQANLLGGLRFIYHLAQEENPAFKVEAANYLDLSRRLFEQKELMNQVRQRLKKEGVTKHYKSYIKERGAPTISGS